MTIHGKTPALPTTVHDGPGGDEDLPILSLADILRVIHARKLTILGTAALVVAITGLALSQMTPLYRATAYVMLDQRQNNVTGADAVVSGLSTDPTSIENQVQILRSRTLAGKVVDRLNLATDPEFTGSDEGKASGLQAWLNSLGAREWLNQSGVAEWLDPSHWFAADASANALPVDLPSFEPLDPKDGLINRVLANLTVSAQGRSSAIAVTFVAKDAEQSAKLANTLAAAYVEDQLDVKSEATQKASKWLAERLEDVAAETQSSERAVEQYKVQNNLTDSTNGASITEQQLSALNAQLVSAQADLAQQEAKFAQVTSMKDFVRSADISQVVASSLISQLRQQETEVLRQEAELGTRYGPLHPKVVDLNSQKQNLALKIDEEVRRVVETVRNDVEVARARVRSLQGSLDEITGKAQTENLARVKLSELSAAATSNRALFETFLKRFNEIDGHDAIQTPDARVISPATVPFVPSFPNPVVFYGAAVPGGLVLGLLLAMLSDSLASGFRTQQQVERTLSLPVLAALPEVSGSRRTRRRAADRVIKKPMSAFAEAVRGLQLGMVLAERPPKVVVVTSSVPSEGKTTVAVSLARLAARSLRRVILVDADLRQPAVIQATNISQSQPGIVEALTGTPLEECLCKDPMSDALILPGRCLANPSDVLASGQMTRMIQSLAEFLRSSHHRFPAASGDKRCQNSRAVRRFSSVCRALGAHAARSGSARSSFLERRDGPHRRRGPYANGLGAVPVLQLRQPEISQPQEVLSELTAH